MNTQDFEAQLRADGYTEIETQTLEPRPGKGRHRHLFALGAAAASPASTTSPAHQWIARDLASVADGLSPN